MTPQPMQHRGEGATLAPDIPETPETPVHTFDILFPRGYVPTPERMVESLLEYAGNTVVDKMVAAGMSEDEIRQYIPLHLDEIADFVLRILFHPAAVHAVRRAAEHHRALSSSTGKEQ